MKRKAPRCSKCGYTGHNARTCSHPKRASKPKRKQRCSFCSGLAKEGRLSRTVGRHIHVGNMFFDATYDPEKEMYNHRADACPLWAAEVVLEAHLRTEHIITTQYETLFKRGLGPGALYDAVGHGLCMVTHIDWGFEGRTIEPLTVKNVATMRGSMTPLLYFRSLKQGGPERCQFIEWLRPNRITSASSKPFEVPDAYRDPLLPHHLQAASYSIER